MGLSKPSRREGHPIRQQIKDALIVMAIVPAIAVAAMLMAWII